MAGSDTRFQEVIDYIRPVVDAFAERVNGKVVANPDPMHPSLEVDVPVDVSVKYRYGTRGSVYIAVNPWWAPHTVSIAIQVPYEMRETPAHYPRLENIPLSFVKPLVLEELVTQLNGLGTL